MKIQIMTEGLRLRLTYQELEQLPTTPVLLACNDFSWTLKAGGPPHSTLEGWPMQSVLNLSQRDFNDLQAEPENGIVLSHLSPRVVLEVDKRDKH